jgi:hypothetical protein
VAGITCGFGFVPALRLDESATIQVSRNFHPVRCAFRTRFARPTTNPVPVRTLSQLLGHDCVLEQDRLCTKWSRKLSSSCIWTRTTSGASEFSATLAVPILARSSAREECRPIRQCGGVELDYSPDRISKALRHSVKGTVESWRAGLVLPLSPAEGAPGMHVPPLPSLPRWEV